MTPVQKNFVSLEKQKEKVKEYFESLRKAVDEVAKEVGIGGMFQDEEGTVYKVVEPEGRFVNYEKISYKRTRRINEERGDLSIKEAEAAGYSVPTKR